MGIQRYIEMTWQEVERLDFSSSLLALPVGSVEQHGPQLPLDTDTITACHIIEKLAEQDEARTTVLAPPLRYTYGKQSAVFPGTLTVNGETLITLSRDVLHSFMQQGFRKIVVVNGHMENTDFVTEGIALSLEKVPDAKVMLCNWWEMVEEQEIKEIVGPHWKGWVDEHAALVETSLMLAIAPHLVRRDRIVDDTRVNPYEFRIFPWDRRNYPSSGAFTSTTGADGKKGKALIEVVVTRLRRVLDSVFTG